jgi:hypothetical protein
MKKHVAYATSKQYANFNRIGGARVTLLAPTELDREFEPYSGQFKDFKYAFAASRLSAQV